MLRQTFRSLTGFNYRLWAAGALVANLGAWMQRTAQDWIVFTTLTREDASAVGILMALQFGPSLFLMPLTGWVADRFDGRRVLLVTQSLQALLALGLGVLVLQEAATLWQVYLFALALGCVTAFDAPVRQTFVASMVSDANLSNAVALNATSFQLTRMAGPAIAGLLIAVIGAGWMFIFNFAGCGAVIASLLAMRVGELHRPAVPRNAAGGLTAGLRYVRSRPDLFAILTMLFVVAAFCMNFAVFVPTMAVTVFGSGSGGFGLLVSMLAIGSIVGALGSAHRTRPRAILLLHCGALMTLFFIGAASAPTYLGFGLALILLGWALQTFMTTANATVQLWTEPAMRGRVMALYVGLVNGSTVIGSPFMGWVANHFGARWALVAAATAALLVTGVGLHYLVQHRGLQIERHGLKLRAVLKDPPDPAPDRENRPAGPDPP